MRLQVIIEKQELQFQFLASIMNFTTQTIIDQFWMIACWYCVDITAGGSQEKLHFVVTITWIVFTAFQRYEVKLLMHPGQWVLLPCHTTKPKNTYVSLQTGSRRVTILNFRDIPKPDYHSCWNTMIYSKLHLFPCQAVY